MGRYFHQNVVRKQDCSQIDPQDDKSWQKLFDMKMKVSSQIS